MLIKQVCFNTLKKAFAIKACIQQMIYTSQQMPLKILNATSSDSKTSTLSSSDTHLNSILSYYQLWSSVKCGNEKKHEKKKKGIYVFPFSTVPRMTLAGMVQIDFKSTMETRYN